MRESKSKWNLFRQKTHIIIYGTNTVAGRLFDIILLIIILLSVIVVMLETIKGLDQKYHTEIMIIEWIITIFFTVEYILRIVSINKPFRYIFSFYGIIDLIAILPMYLSLFLIDTHLMVVVRALRLLRLFKILNHPQFSSQSIHLREALLASRGKILVFMYFILVNCILIGSVMYVVEGEEAGFTSIPTSIYWCIVTLTTVGFGDITPITPFGQFIASFVMILGYGIIAVPTGIVTAEIAKNKSNTINFSRRNPCKKCGTEDHRYNAEYCYNCGSELNDN